jgi:hypothetical protein
MSDRSETTVTVTVWDTGGRRTQLARTEPGIVAVARQAEIVGELARVVATYLTTDAKVPPVNYVG